MDLIQALKNIGFTQQEAIIYITLCKNGILSGYEAAKISGISRSNAYSALSSLVEKGGASIIDGSTTKYLAVPKNELLMNAQRFFEKNIEYIRSNLSEKTNTTDPYITILSYDNIVHKIKNMILLGSTCIYLSASPDHVNLFASEISQAVTKGLKVVVISSLPVKLDHIIFYSSHKTLESFKIIVDTSEVLTGKLESGDHVQCLYSKNKTLVNLIREAFINEIELIKIQKNNI